MKYLLQNFESGLYLADGVTWTAEPEKALAFPDQRRATEYKMAHRLVFNAFAVISPEPEPTQQTPTGRREAARLRLFRHPLIGATAPGRAART